MYNIFMPTSIHLPRELLAEVERRAKALKISRNHLIVTVLEQEFARRTEWSASFRRQLGELGNDGDAFASELETVVKKRTRKPALQF
jgi:predicted transcriptional regulator